MNRKDFILSQSLKWRCSLGCKKYIMSWEVPFPLSYTSGTPQTRSLLLAEQFPGAGCALHTRSSPREHSKQLGKLELIHFLLLCGLQVLRNSISPLFQLWGPPKNPCCNSKHNNALLDWVWHELFCCPPTPPSKSQGKLARVGDTSLNPMDMKAAPEQG